MKDSFMISVIMPAYNAERYIYKTIQCVLNQTFRNLELVIVDDGSSDKTRLICERFQNEDSRVIYYQQENLGVAKARNKALSIARGDYFFFIDSDDYLRSDALEKLYLEACNNKVDIVSTNYRSIDENERIGETRCGILNFKRDMGRQFWTQNITNQPWGKLYKKELFYNVTYPDIRVYEDVATTYKLYMKAKKISHTNAVLYYYVQHDGSLISNCVLSDIENLCNIYKNIYKSVDISNEYYRFYLETILFTIYSRTFIVTGCSDEDKVKIRKFVDSEQSKVKVNIFKFIDSPFFVKILMKRLGLVGLILRLRRLVLN